MGRLLSKIITTAISAATVAILFTAGVHAEGLIVTADKESYEIGDKVTVTVDASAIEGETPPDIQVEFDANRLNFENCSVEYGGGGGGLVTFKDKQATVEFSTLSGGDATVSVTATAEDAASPETANVTVLVNGEDTAAAMSTQASTTGVSEGAIDIGDGRVVQKVFADEFKPILFHKDTTEFKGETVECASFDMADMKLLYTTDASGSDGSFMILNPSTEELDDFRMIQGIENRFIIVLSDCEGPIPDGYTKAVLEWNNQTLTAFMEENVAAGSSEAVDGVNPADFFLVYAMSSEGNKGWYRYDKNEGTYQRFLNTGGSSSTGEGGSSDDESGSYESFLDEYIPKNIQTILLLICAPLALILLITVIILAVKLHDYAEDLDAFYEEYYGDEDEAEEDEEEYYHRAKPGAVTAASLVGRSMADEEDEEEDEDDDDEDEDEDVEDDEDEEADEEDEDDDEDDEEDEVNEEEEEEEEEEAEEEEEEDVKPYKPMTRKERKELEREERWRQKEEKKAAKLRAKGYEEATPMDWSSFETGRSDDDERSYKNSTPPKYMTESMKGVEEEEKKSKKAPLPPRKKVVVPEEDADAAPVVLKEEEQREKQRRLFEQQQRIEEQRRIEDERIEAERQKEQQQFIASRTEDMDLDEDFQFEFLDL